MSIPYEPMRVPLSMHQCLRLVDAGVWLFLYSLFVVLSDFSIFQRALFEWFLSFSKVMSEDGVRAGFVGCSVMVILAAWFEKRTPLLIAKGYVALLTALSLMLIGYSLTGSILDTNFHIKIRQLLTHNTTAPISTLQNAGYTIYLQLSLIQITAIYVLHLVLIHLALNNHTIGKMHQRIGKLDVRVWLVVLAVASWAGDTVLFESVLRYGLHEFQMVYLGAMLFSFFLLFAAFTNEMWALKAVKYCSLFVIAFLTMRNIILLVPLFVLPTDSFSWQVAKFAVLNLDVMLVVWIVQWWLVKRVVERIEEERKVNVELEDIV